MNKLIEILQRIHDEADHILGTEAYFTAEVCRGNAEAIKALAKEGLGKIEELTEEEKKQKLAELAKGYCEGDDPPLQLIWLLEDAFSLGRSARHQSPDSSVG